MGTEFRSKTVGGKEMCQSLFIRCLLCGVEVAAEGIATRADGLGLGAASLENPDGYSAVSS